jgi:hypothetical protein
MAADDAATSEVGGYGGSPPGRQLQQEAVPRSRAASSVPPSLASRRWKKTKIFSTPSKILRVTQQSTGAGNAGR